MCPNFFGVRLDANKILSHHELPPLLIENSHYTVATLVQYIHLNHRFPHRLAHKLLSLHSSIAICFPFSSWGMSFSQSPWKTLPFDPCEKTFPPCWPSVLLWGKRPANRRPAEWMSWGDLANKQPHATETFLNTIIMFFKWTRPAESLRMM